MRVAEQCEDCAYSTYGGDVGVCAEYTGGLCLTVNPENNCQMFEHPQIRTRCVEDESEGA